MIDIFAFKRLKYMNTSQYLHADKVCISYFAFILMFSFRFHCFTHAIVTKAICDEQSVFRLLVNIGRLFIIHFNSFN